MEDPKTLVYDQLDASKEANVTGYDEGSGHEFAASQHARILELKGSEPSIDFDATTRDIERSTLKMQLALDASELLAKNRLANAELAAKFAADNPVAPMPQIAVQSRYEFIEQSMAEPDKAAAQAVVEANAPVGTPLAELSARGFQEWQSATAAKYVEGKKWIFSKDSYAADFAALLALPGRTLTGQVKAGNRLGSKEGYIEFINEWHKLPQGVQEQLWEDTLRRLKDASGGNDLVFMGLVEPLIDPNGATAMPYADAAFDLIDSAASVFAAYKLAKLAKGRFAYRNRVLAHGNKTEAGKATLKDIKKGDPDAVADGHPIQDPLAPSKLAGPAQLQLEAELRASGRLADGEDVVEKAPALDGPDLPAAIADRQARVERAGGRVISTETGPTGVEFTFLMPEKGITYTVRDLDKAVTNLQKIVTETTNEIKLLVAGSEPGTTSSQLVTLTAKLDAAKQGLAKIAEHAQGGVTGPVTLEGPPIFTESKKFFRFTVDDVGRMEFRDENLGWYVEHVGTPEARMAKIRDGLVSFGTNLRQQQRRLFGYFDKMVTDVRTGLSNRELEDLDNLLLTGDRKQHIFTEDELRAGVSVDGVGHIAFGEPSIKAYQQMRKGYDDLYYLTNRMLVDELEFGGYQMFFGKYTDPKGVAKGVRLFGKTNSIAFTPPMNGYKNRVSSVLDLRASSASKGDPVSLGAVTDLDAKLASKKVGFVELRYPLRNGDGKQYNYALVEVDEFGGAKNAHKPDRVLDYRTGYVPKLAQENVRWVVERAGERYVDGTKVADSQVVRGFETEAEATIFLRQMQAKGGKGSYSKTQLTDDWRVDVRNREKNEFINNSLFEGAFTGHREKKSTFRIGLDGREAARMSSFDSLQRYADYVASNVPMHEWKQAMIKRFLNTANADGKQMIQIAGRWDSPVNGTGSASAQLKSMQDYMKSVFAVPTTEEGWYHRIIDRSAAHLENVIFDVKKGKARRGSSITTKLHRSMTTDPAWHDPISAMKSMTFDLMLGMFNPAQYFVQSAGMFIPITLRPVDSAVAFPEFLFLRNAYRAGDYKEVAKAAKTFGMNPKKMETMLHALHRSGIPDSILENADFGHYAGTHGAYYSPSMFQRVRDKSRFFYNAGEMNNRLFSFTIAFNNKAKEHGWDLTKKLNSEQLNEVVKEALRIGTNMTAANKAKWQDGILGLPTQFWQQTHKYYENLVYGAFKKAGSKENQWTGAESVTALAMNVLLFGAAGYGLDELFSDLDRSLIDGWGLDPEKDRGTIALIRGGLLEMLSFAAFDFEVDVADRVGPSSGTTIVYEKIFKPFAEAAMSGRAGDWGTAFGNAFLGPTGTSMTRFTQAGIKFVDNMGAQLRAEEWDLDSLIVVARDISTTTTTMTNFEKALAWKAANDILTNQDMPLYIMEHGVEIPSEVYLLKAMGFDPLAKEKMEKLLRTHKLTQQDKASLARNIASDYRRYILASKDGSMVAPAEMKAARNRIAMRRAKLAEIYGQAAADEVAANVLDILNKEGAQYGYSDFQKELFKAILEATPESDLEKQVRGDAELAKSLAQIKGQEQDAE